MADAAEKMPQTAAAKQPDPRMAREWDPIETLRRQMDRLIDDLGRGWGLQEPFGNAFFALRPSWLMDEAGSRKPPVDLIETETCYQIVAEFPGIAAENLDVKLANGVLTIKGEKKDEREENKKGTYVAERRFGSFQRSFQLPEGIDQDTITAAFSNGVLTVSLPKAAEAQKAEKTIAIASA